MVQTTGMLGEGTQIHERMMGELKWTELTKHTDGIHVDMGHLKSGEVK